MGSILPKLRKGKHLRHGVMPINGPCFNLLVEVSWCNDAFVAWFDHMLSLNLSKSDLCLHDKAMRKVYLHLVVVVSFLPGL